MIISLAFLGAYAWPILQPGLPRQTHRELDWFTWLTWLLFVIDYAARWWLSVDRHHFVRTSIIDLGIIVLPVLRPLRVLRLITLLSVLNRRVASSVRGRVAVYVVGASVLVIFCASLAVLDAERRSPKGNIRTFGDALWWAVSTVTTVGYGDHYPVTGEGRAVAGLLMIGGIALLGVVTASVASWLLDPIHVAEEASQALTQHDIEVLTAQVVQLRIELHAVHETVQGRTADDAGQGVRHRWD